MASTPRRSRSGEAEFDPICQRPQGVDSSVCRGRGPLLWPSAPTGCCRSTIASTSCSRRPASDALFIAPLAAGKHRPIARCRRRQAGEKSRENEPDHQDATVKRFHYDDRDQLRRHLADFVAAYNFGRKLKTLKGLTPCEFIWKAWASQPERSLSIRSSKCRD